MEANPWKSFFAGKRVTQLGLGLLGRGVRDAEFMAENEAILTVTDSKSRSDLEESVSKLSKYSNITFVLGEHRLEDFENKDFILKGAGVPIDSIYVSHAKENNIPVYMDEALFTMLAPDVKQIGVTGTRGKSTVTMLIHHILSDAFFGSKNNIFLGGNIKDVATLPFLSQAKKDDVLVAELSSWQLQGYVDLKISPQIAVFTNLLPDHLNYYKDDIELYFKDKAGIYLNQKLDDVLICTDTVLEMIEKYSLPAPSRVIRVTADDYEKFFNVSKLVGEHNALNVALAVCACREYGISDDKILKSIATFSAVPGRLQKIKEADGVSIYNDTNSTTPESLIAGLKGLGETVQSPDKKIVLIMGGADKNLDFADLYDAVGKYAKAVISTPGTGTDRIFGEMERVCVNGEIPLIRAKSTAEAVSASREYLKKGDILLFSPGFASFSEFKNEYDRGEKFEQFVEQNF